MTRALLVADTGRARACVTDPVLFASTDVLDHTLAARLCDVCPVAVSCREAVDATAVHRPDLLTGTYGEAKARDLVEDYPHHLLHPTHDEGDAA